ncbi:MAG: FIST C-terminal domain-containing protein [Bacillota bacterium]|nr:FIST C-terminal domain-containing protein [Bacillota bacterium]
MAGKIREMINRIIEERSKGNPAIEQMTIAKLILKGLNPNRFDSSSADDPEIINKLLIIAKQLNVMNIKEDCINIRSAYSTKASAADAAEDIKSQLTGCNAKLLVFFAAPDFDQENLCSLLQQAFINSIVVGCSTAGEIVSGKLLNNSVAAMAVNSNIISDAKAEVIDLKNENESINAAFNSFEEYFHESAYDMDAAKYVGLILIDGVSMKEEKIMDLIGNRTNVFFIGGSAGDNFRFKETQVCAGGKAYTDASVLVMLKISDRAEFGIIKTQSFKALDKVLIASKVNKEMREVIEFNNKPAAEAYAEAIGISPAEDVSKYFAAHPVGLQIGDNDIFVRSPLKVNGTSIKFFCNILEGMEVRLLQATNIIEDTRKALEDKIIEMGRIDGIINFNCIERTMELQKKNLQREYGEIFKDIPTIGFSTYGEQYIGHLNQTAAMLVFKQKNII